MANAISVNIRPKKYAKPSLNNLLHNTGLEEATYWIKDKSYIYSSIDIDSKEKAEQIWQNWLNEAKKRYTERVGKKVQKKQILIEEGLIIIGRDVEDTAPETIVKIFKDFKEWFEKRHNTKVLGYFYHAQEGHIDLVSNEFKQNRHIHFFFSNVSNEGLSVRRTFKKEDLSELQTKIYECAKKYIPTIERAENYLRKGQKSPKHIPHRIFRELRRKEEVKRILDNHNIKRYEQMIKLLNQQLERYKKTHNGIKGLARAHFDKELEDNEVLIFANEKFVDLVIENEKIKSLKKEINELKNAPAPAPKIEYKEIEKIVYKEDTKKIKELEDELKKERIKKDEYFELLQKKEEMIKLLNQQLLRIKKDKERLEDKIEELEKQTEKLKRKNEELSETLKEYKNEKVSELRKFIEKNIDEDDSIDEEIKKMREQINEIEIAKKAKINELDDIEKLVLDIDDYLRDENRQIERLNKEIQELEEQKRAKKREDNESNEIKEDRKTPKKMTKNKRIKGFKLR